MHFCQFTVLPFDRFYRFYRFTLLPFLPFYPFYRFTARLAGLDLLPFYRFTLLRCALVSENHRKQKAPREPPQHIYMLYWVWPPPSNIGKLTFIGIPHPSQKQPTWRTAWCSPLFLRDFGAAFCIHCVVVRMNDLLHSCVVVIHIHSSAFFNSFSPAPQAAFNSTRGFPAICLSLAISFNCCLRLALPVVVERIIPICNCGKLVKALAWRNCCQLAMQTCSGGACFPWLWWLWSSRSHHLEPKPNMDRSPQVRNWSRPDLESPNLQSVPDLTSKRSHIKKKMQGNVLQRTISSLILFHEDIAVDEKNTITMVINLRIQVLGWSSKWCFLETTEDSPEDFLWLFWRVSGFWWEDFSLEDFSKILQLRTKKNNHSWCWWCCRTEIPLTKKHLWVMKSIKMFKEIMGTWTNKN